MLILFEAAALERDLGKSGLNEIYVNLAARIQSEVGIVNSVGRYCNNGFIVLLESIYSERDLHRLSLMVATHAARPLQVKAHNEKFQTVNLPVGLGVVKVADGRVEVDAILHEAEQLAHSAHHMRFRAAIRDPLTHHSMPLEQVYQT